ncbi:MAG TPA: YdcF family protein [Actinomycetes bacterium]|nr:YdcF family protein [Actinomycetes bacterium]
MRRILLLVAFLVLGYFAVTTTLVTAWMGRDQRPRVDAIVVLGAAQYNGHPSPIYQARLDHALDLYRSGVAPIMVVTGGRGVAGERFTEGGTGRRWMIEHGVPERSVLVEESSRTTYQNLRGVRELLVPRDLRRVVLVSDPFHMFRAVEQARDVGLEAYSSPTRSSPVSGRPLRMAWAVTREDLAVGGYFLLGLGK